MSADIAEPTTDRTVFVDRASRVLNDFTVRLKELAQYLGDKKTQPEAVQRFKALRPPAEEFARQVSAEIEVGRASDLEKAELWLRLADFEYYLEKCTRRANEADGKPTPPSAGQRGPKKFPWVVHST